LDLGASTTLIKLFPWLFVAQEDIASSTDYDPSFVLQLTKETKDEIDIKEPAKTVQAVAWLDSMYEDSGLTMSQANKAATIIQVNKPR